MAIKTKSGYACGYCKKEYRGSTGLADAENCKESHDLVFLQISREDLNRLLLFIYTKDDSALGDEIVRRLQSYMKTSFDLDINKAK